MSAGELGPLDTPPVPPHTPKAFGLTTDLVHRLQLLADASAANDGSRLIARYLLQHLNDLDSLSVQNIADACYASIATVSRFVRSLGYDSFAKLRQAAARKAGRAAAGAAGFDLEHITNFSTSDGSADSETAGSGSAGPGIAGSNTAGFGIANSSTAGSRIAGFSASLGEDGFSGLWLYANEISSALRRFAEMLDRSAVDKLAALLLNCRTAALFGIYQPGLIARHLQFLLLSAGRYTEYYDLMEDHAERAKTMSSGDLAVIFSVDGNYFACFEEVISLMEQRGVSLVLVTQNRTLAGSHSFEQVILLGGQDSAAAGCYKLQLFAEVLFARYLSISHSLPAGQ